MMKISKERANDVAFQIAITEIVQRMIAENLYNFDQNVFSRKVRALEEGVLKSVSSSKLYPQLEQSLEADLNRQASDIVARIFSGITHPTS